MKMSASGSTWLVWFDSPTVSMLAKKVKAAPFSHTRRQEGRKQHRTQAWASLHHFALMGHHSLEISTGDAGVTGRA